MNMFWNVKRCVSGEWGSAAFAHMLRGAMIAAVVLSCSTMNATAQEAPPVPPVMWLDNAELVSAIKAHASSVYPGLQLQNVYVTISYIDGEDQERLVSLVSNHEDVPDESEQTRVKESSFTIPTPKGEGTTDFVEAIVVFTDQTPDGQTSCGSPSSAGGDRLCRP